ncbi:MAG: 3-carboxy-cis,cis-muconate cycloisomerase [Acidobacteria bacterium SCN 69-37]|nr:MAG: 3-carboxy-cis,cis-muconate cycloisomerase [Acidobacteria bacterium SCN 69-37]
MPSPLTHTLVTTDAVGRAFADEALFSAMCRFEIALARAEAVAGVIPDAAATAIADVVRTAAIDDAVALRVSLRANATLSIAVVQALSARVAQAHPEAARYVHWGATSQDVFDTALMLCLRDAWIAIEADHLRLMAALDALAVRHARTVMLGRTLLQPAVPTTFGLKAAGWLGTLARSWRAWASTFDRTQVVQFGGAAGTLSALGTHGPAVEQALAEDLGLEIPDAPWHAHRDRLAAFVAAAGVYVGALGKLAGDVALLMQPEIGEAFEAGGGSSTMPHKRNPSRCAVVVACAHRVPGLVATMLGAMVQEHERAVGGWHVEAATLVDTVQASASAAASMADVLESLTIDDVRMRANIEATRGTIFAERLVMRLAPDLGRQEAAALVKTALEAAAASGRSLADAAADLPALADRLTADERATLFEADTYLGSAETFRARLLAAAAAPGSRRH